MGTGQTTPTGSSLWGTAAHDRCARCRERNLLSVANWLPMAPAPSNPPRSTRTSRATRNRIRRWERVLPHQFPPWGTVYHYFRCWESSGIWAQLHRAIYAQARVAAGRATSPSVVIMDGQSVKTTERGGTNGFDGRKRVKGRKRHILVDTLGLLVANRVEPANISDRRAAARLLGGLSPLFPRIHGDRRCWSRKPQARP